jgi:U3 small nucleolar RNA-associated protein 23
MRYLRAKGIRKALRQFHFLCGIKPPFKVLLDGNFIAMCLQMKVDVRERVPKYLQVKPHEVEFFVPRAALDELRVLGEATKEAYELAQSFKVAEAYDLPKKKGEDEPADVSQCIQHLVGDKNERKFVVCTQEVELRKALRLVPGVPLLYLNRSVLVFEEISRATLAIVRQEEKANMAKLDVNEKRKLEQMQVGEAADQEEQQRLTKKRAKGPNPLSNKKPVKKKVRAKKKKN